MSVFKLFAFTFYIKFHLNVVSYNRIGTKRENYSKYKFPYINFTSHPEVFAWTVLFSYTWNLVYLLSVSCFNLSLFKSWTRTVNSDEIDEHLALESKIQLRLTQNSQIKTRIITTIKYNDVLKCQRWYVIRFYRHSSHSYKSFYWSTQIDQLTGKGFGEVEIFPRNLWTNIVPLY